MWCGRQHLEIRLKISINSADGFESNIRRYEDRTPPRALRVCGNIRTLIERQPTDEARENAPAYIRQNMGPTDTFVRSYTKSGEIGTDKLLDHLNTRSSLADFLGTAPLLESD